MNYELLGQAIAQFFKDIHAIAESSRTRSSMSDISYSSEEVSDETAKQLTEIKPRKESVEIGDLVLDLSREAIEGYLRGGERGLLIKVVNALAKEGFGDEVTSKVNTSTLTKRLQSFLDQRGSDSKLITAAKVAAEAVPEVVETVTEVVAPIVKQVEASFAAMLGLGSDTPKADEVVTPVNKPRRAPIAKLAAFTDKIAGLTKSFIDKGKDRDAVINFVNAAIEKASYDGSVRGVSEDDYEKILEDISSEFSSVEDFGAMLERLLTKAEDEGYERADIEKYAYEMANKTGANVETFNKICKAIGLSV